MNCADKKESGNGTDRVMPRDIGLLLSEIEREAVPDRLMVLAKELQQALCERRKHSAEAGEDMAAINPPYRPQTRP